MRTSRNLFGVRSAGPEGRHPGFGFAVADIEEDAKRTAMAICRASAGKARQQFCKVAVTLCDK
jgi:hypothetical protein